MGRLCLQCGCAVPLRAKGCGGNQPGFCSEQCRRRRKRQTTKRWIVAHHEQQLSKAADYRKRYKAEDPDCFKRFYAENKERRKQESLAWYRANAEYVLQRQKAYVATRPIDVVRAQGRRSANTRRAVKKRVFVEVVDARTVFERDKGQCGICMTPVDPTSPWEVDHIMPISKGGPHSYANVQLAHRKCNRSKAAKCA